MANIVVSALSTFNNKGLKKGKKEIGIFEKQLKTFQRTFLAAFSVTALIRFSKTAVNAFMADEKAAKSLEQQLKNTGYQFSAPGVELYIANLQKATGVLDDELRPAFQQILTVTGSIIKSQEALNTALNVSAATGKSVTEVSAALAKGFAGQTTALARLGAGLNKATLKTGDMDKILDELNDKFAGQAQARLSTYAGKMDLLKVASENAKEEIGKGLLGALEILGKDTSIEDTTRKMENLGKETGNTIRGLAVLIKKISDLPGVGLVGKAIYETSIFGALARLGKANQPTRELPANEQRSAGRISAAQRKQEARALKESTTLRKQEITQLKAKTAVDKLKDQFDLERIGISKALNEATDAETKLRLKSQLAILNNNEALAEKYLAELAAAEAAKKLAETYNMALESVKLMNTKIAAFLLSIQMQGNKLPNTLTSMTGPISTGGNEITGTPGGGIFDPSFARAGENRDLTITVDTTGTGDRFAALIAESLQIAQKSGVSYGIAGGL